MVGKQFEIKTDYETIIDDFFALKIDKKEMGKWSQKLAKRINVRLKDFERQGLTESQGYRTIMAKLKIVEGENATRFSQSAKFDNAKTMDKIYTMVSILNRKDTTVGQEKKKLREALEIAKENDVPIMNKDQLIEFRKFWSDEEFRNACMVVGYGAAKDAVLKLNSKGIYDRKTLRERFNDEFSGMEKKPRSQRQNESQWTQVNGEGDFLKTLFG